MTSRVLYVTHTAELGGGERSLLDLLRLLPSSVDPIVACPDGTFARRLRSEGFAVVLLPAVGGLGGGPARVLLELARCGLALRRHARRLRVDVVHAGSLRAGLAAAFSGVPFVVDVRDCLPARGIAGAAQRFLGRTASSVFANSAHTAAAFAAAAGAAARVVHPLVDLEPFLSLPRPAPQSPPVAAVVGQLTPWKGQADAIAALRDVPGATLLVAGSATFRDGTRHDNVGYEQTLRNLAAPLGGRVRFLGDVDDVAALLARVDVLLVPSWEEPFGRVVLEGMAAGLPVVATSVGGPAEMIRDGVDGVLLPPRQPARWAATIAALLNDRERMRGLGAAARARAAEFQRERGRRLECVLDGYPTARAAVPVQEAVAHV